MTIRLTTYTVPEQKEAKTGTVVKDYGFDKYVVREDQPIPNHCGTRFVFVWQIVKKEEVQ